MRLYVIGTEHCAYLACFFFFFFFFFFFAYPCTHEESNRPWVAVPVGGKWRSAGFTHEIIHSKLCPKSFLTILKCINHRKCG